MKIQALTPTALMKRWIFNAQQFTALYNEMIHQFYHWSGEQEDYTDWERFEAYASHDAYSDEFNKVESADLPQAYYTYWQNYLHTHSQENIIHVPDYIYVWRKLDLDHKTRLMHAFRQFDIITKTAGETHVGAVVEQQLDELNLKQAIAAGIIGASTLGHGVLKHTEPTMPPAAVQQHQQEVPVDVKVLDPEMEKMASAIASRYRINTDQAYEIVELAHKYEKPVFPKAKDILAVVGIESSFNPNAVSALRFDPARGLMQVRAGIWNINPEELHDMEMNIKHGSDILYQYFRKFKNKQKALSAYNVGLTSQLRGEDNPGYVEKFAKERRRLEKI